MKRKSLKLNIRPYPQYEGHTCGLCALKAIFGYYGLVTVNLRERLNVDSPLGVDLVEGTFQNHLARVLIEERFEVDFLGEDLHEELPRMAAHLSKRHPIMGLIQTGEKLDDLHWIVVAGIELRDEVSVIDSAGVEVNGRLRRKYSINTSKLSKIWKRGIAVKRSKKPKRNPFGRVLAKTALAGVSDMAVLFGEMKRRFL